MQTRASPQVHCSKPGANFFVGLRFVAMGNYVDMCIYIYINYIFIYIYILYYINYIYIYNINYIYNMYIRSIFLHNRILKQNNSYFI